MRDFVRSGWLSTIVIVLSWILLFGDGVLLHPGSNEGTMWFDLGEFVNGCVRHRLATRDIANRLAYTLSIAGGAKGRLKPANPSHCFEELVSNPGSNPCPGPYPIVETS